MDNYNIALFYHKHPSTSTVLTSCKIGEIVYINDITSSQRITGWIWEDF